MSGKPSIRYRSWPSRPAPLWRGDDGDLVRQFGARYPGGRDPRVIARGYHERNSDVIARERKRYLEEKARGEGLWRRAHEQAAERKVS